MKGLRGDRANLAVDCDLSNEGKGLQQGGRRGCSGGGDMQWTPVDERKRMIRIGGRTSDRESWDA